MRGGCHCGNISLELTLSVAPEEIETRLCQCNFCRKHGARTVSDSGGHVTITTADEQQLEKYRFGQKTADFYLCRRCGVFVAAVITENGRATATINVEALDDRLRFTKEALPVSYEGESAETRTARRIERWTPATINDG